MTSEKTELLSPGNQHMNPQGINLIGLAGVYRFIPRITSLWPQAWRSSLSHLPPTSYGVMGVEEND